MGLYNFKKRFVPFVLDGSKTHTIRALRVHGDQPGNPLYLYTGLRQKGAKRLLVATCTKIESFVMTENFEIFIDGILLSPDECNALAYRDGFRDRGSDHAFEEMLQFWKDRPLPFEGKIVHWKVA